MAHIFHAGWSFAGLARTFTFPKRSNLEMYHTN